MAPVLARSRRPRSSKVSAARSRLVRGSAARSRLPARFRARETGLHVRLRHWQPAASRNPLQTIAIIITMAGDDAVAERDQSSSQLTAALATSAEAAFRKTTAATRSNMRELEELATDMADARTLGRRCSILAQMLAVAMTGEPVRVLARVLVCAYYVNLTISEIEAWQHATRTPAAAAAAAARHATSAAPTSALVQQQDLPFPWLHVLGVLPSAVLAATGLLLPWLFAALLFGFTLWHDATYVAHHLLAVVTWKQSPTEILMRVFGMAGSCALLALYSAAGASASAPGGVRRCAGLLLGSEPRRRPLHGRARSLGLLLARLMVAALLVWLGVGQVRRIHARLVSPGPPGPLHYGRWEPHDNNWTLVQMALGVPIALGLWVAPVARLLCLALLLEATLVWRWWQGSALPSWYYAAHMREHFFLNLGLCGGLLLMQSLGPGMFSADALMEKED